MEEPSARHRAVVRTELAFEHEARRETVAEIFGALEAPAVRDGLAALHLGLIGRVGPRAVLVDMLVVETRVDDAVDRHVGCGARCEKRAQGPDEERGKCGTKVLGHGRLLFFFDG